MTSYRCLTSHCETQSFVIAEHTVLITMLNMALIAVLSLTSVMHWNRQIFHILSHAQIITSRKLFFARYFNIFNDR